MHQGRKRTFRRERSTLGSVGQVQILQKLRLLLLLREHHFVMSGRGSLVPRGWKGTRGHLTFGLIGTTKTRDSPVPSYRKDTDGGLGWLVALRHGAYGIYVRNLLRCATTVRHHHARRTSPDGEGPLLLPASHGARAGRRPILKPVRCSGTYGSNVPFERFVGRAAPLLGLCDTPALKAAFSFSV